MTTSALFTFAPKFCEFGADIAKFLRDELGSDLVVHGIGTGSAKVRTRVTAALGALAGEFHELDVLEPDWFAMPVTSAELEAFETTYPTGSFGRTITADRRIGVGYTGNGRPRPDRIADLVLRDPETAPARYVIRLYQFLEQTVDRIRPDMIFCYVVAGAPALALSIIAARHGIPFYQLAPTRLGAGYTIDTATNGELVPVAERYKARTQIGAPFKEMARSYLADFREKPRMPYYQQFHERNKKQNRLLRQFATKKLSALKTGMSAAVTGKARKKESARRKWQEGSLALAEYLAGSQAFASENQLPERFVFYPLHFSPEASTMVLSPSFTDQVAVVEALSKALPADCVLVVKEHPSMLGRRPADYYRRLAQFPRVMLIDPGVSGLSLVQKAALVAVITGTAAWEALLLQRPALLLGPAQFRCLGTGTVFETDFTRLADSLARAMETPPAADEDLVDYLAALMEESIDLPTEVFWGEYLEEPEAKRLACARDAARLLARRYAQAT